LSESKLQMIFTIKPKKARGSTNPHKPGFILTNRIDLHRIIFFQQKVLLKKWCLTNTRDTIREQQKSYQNKLFHRLL
jgi:hypothetical protein